eukprot:6193937-Pleurochrysis_carterae.AAC.1
MAALATDVRMHARACLRVHTQRTHTRPKLASKSLARLHATTTNASQKLADAQFKACMHSRAVQYTHARISSCWRFPVWACSFRAACWGDASGRRLRRGGAASLRGARRV